jgi:TRAP-type mannitol/chloroaromatic compound transport system permease large subunit
MSNEQRTAIYGAFAAILTALGVFGVITAEESTAYGAAGVELLAAASSLMSAVKTWKQRGAAAKVLVHFDGINVENAEAFTEAIKRLRGVS